MTPEQTKRLENLKNVIRLLHEYNHWRRGGDGDMPDPQYLGQCIDLACNELQKLHDVFETLCALDESAQSSPESVYGLTHDEHKIAKAVR